MNLLARAIGEQLRQLREANGLRQDDAAIAARQSGLPWTRNMIVALEAGRRDLSIDEFVRLPRLLERLGVATEEFQVQLQARGNAAQMRAGGVTTSLDLQVPWASTPGEEDRVARAYRAMDWWRTRSPSGAATETRRKEALLAAYEGAGADLEQKVGRQRKLDPLIVALVAHRRWGRTLTAERDRRVAEQTPADTSPRTLQGIRGHLTRALLQELDLDLTNAQQRLPVARKRKAR